MKNISILIPDAPLILSSVIGPYKIFNSVNQYLMQLHQTNQAFFKVTLVGTGNESVLYDGLFKIRPNYTLDDEIPVDLLVIPAFTGDFEKVLRDNSKMINWIRNKHLNANTEVASFCIGAFILAATGLADDKVISTHWSAETTFKTMFPKIKLNPEYIITDEKGVYSSGGAFSFLNLILYLVEKYCGRQTAIWASKMFEIEMDRVNQNVFTIFKTQKGHFDEAILNAQDYIETKYHEKLNVNELAERFALSRRNFIRRFSKATHNTPLQYIQRVKIEAAKKKLESGNQTINQIMEDVGYSDPKAFRYIFKKFTGINPIDYKNKYNRALSVA